LNELTLSILGMDVPEADFGNIAAPARLNDRARPWNHRDVGARHATPAIAVIFRQLRE
jgi:hypothetical protein